MWPRNKCGPKQPLRKRPRLWPWCCVGRRSGGAMWCGAVQHGVLRCWTCTRVRPFQAKCRDTCLMHAQRISSTCSAHVRREGHAEECGGECGIENGMREREQRQASSTRPNTRRAKAKIPARSGPNPPSPNGHIPAAMPTRMPNSMSTCNPPHMSNACPHTCPAHAHTHAQCMSTACPHACPHTCPTAYPLHCLHARATHVQHMAKKFPTRVQHTPKKFPMHVQHMSDTCLTNAYIHSHTQVQRRAKATSSGFSNAGFWFLVAGCC